MRGKTTEVLVAKEVVGGGTRGNRGVVGRIHVFTVQVKCDANPSVQSSKIRKIEGAETAKTVNLDAPLRARLFEV